MKILFMGTPDFSATVLEKIIESEKHEVVAAVTQPDKPRGRSGKLSYSPVKETAVRDGIPVLQPPKIREKAAIEIVKRYEFDVIVVVAFGQILTQEILDMPKYGCINVHASLLPRWRGAGPIQWSILAGDTETGISTMQMDAGIDTGDILLQEIVPLTGEETGGSLFEKLSKMSGKILLDTLDGVQAGTITPQTQKEEDSTYAGMLKKDMGHLDFSRPAVELERYVRGLNPWPSAYTMLHGKTLKVWKASVDTANAVGVETGTITKVDKSFLSVQTGDGQLILQEVQLEGKKRMPASDFLRGVHVLEGDIFE